MKKLLDRSESVEHFRLRLGLRGTFQAGSLAWNISGSASPTYPTNFVVVGEAVEDHAVRVIAEGRHLFAEIVFKRISPKSPSPFWELIPLESVDLSRFSHPLELLRCPQDCVSYTQYHLELVESEKGKRRLVMACRGSQTKVFKRGCQRDIDRGVLRHHLVAENSKKVSHRLISAL